MLNQCTRGAFTTSVFLAIFVASSAWAGGMTVGENGPRAMGRAGAYTVAVDEAGALYYNPAGLSKTDGFNLNLNLNLITYFGSFDRDTYIFPNNSGQAIRYQKVNNDQRFLPNPMGFVSHDFGLENVTFGAGFYSPAAVPKKAFPAINSKSPNPGPGKPVVSRSQSNAYQLIEQDLIAVYPSIGAAFDIPELNFSFGITLQLAWVNTAVKVAVDGDGFTEGAARLYSESTPNGYFSEENSSLYAPSTIETSGLSGAGIVGFLYEPIPEIGLGFTYRPAHVVHTKGEVKLDLPPELASLVTLNGKDAEFDVPFPHVLRGGINYRHLDPNGFELFDIEFDVVHERWSDLKQFEVMLGGTVSDTGVGLLNNFELPQINMPFYFNNTTSFRLGSDINVLRNRENGDGLTLRLGAFYETAGSPEEYTNLLFASFQRIGVAAGASYEKNNWAIDLGANFIHSPQRTVDEGKIEAFTPLWICNDVPEGEDSIQQDCNANPPGENPGAIINNGEYQVNYLVVSLGFTYGW